MADRPATPPAAPASPVAPDAAVAPIAADLRALAALRDAAAADAAEAGAIEAAVREWAARHPQLAVGWSVLATLLQRQGRHAEALGPLQRAAALAVNEPAPHVNLGHALRRARRPIEAAEAYRRALALRPDHARAQHGLANALRDAGELDTALGWYRSALQQDPGHAEAWLNAGNACQELGRDADAEAAYRRAAALRPAWAAPWFNLHALRLAAGDLPGAIDAMAAAAAREPAEPRHRFFLGLLLDHAGRSTEAAPLLAPLRQGPALVQAWLDAWDHLRAAGGGRLPTLCGTATQTFRLALAAARPDGLVLEFGVRWGKSIRQIAALADGPVHGFDSFEGLPEAWHHEPQGSYSTGGRLPAVPPTVQLHAGWFEASLPPFLAEHPGPVRFANIDCDLYSSTTTVLQALAPRLGPGSVLVFDEYVGNAHWRDDEFKAFQEAVARHGWAHEILCCSFATKQVAVRLR